MTMRYTETPLWLHLALPASIVFGTIWLGLTFRYEVVAQGVTVLVQDRWTGTLERCWGVSGAPTQSRCIPALAGGMKPIEQQAPVKTLGDAVGEDLSDLGIPGVAKRK